MLMAAFDLPVVAIFNVPLLLINWYLRNPNQLKNNKEEKRIIIDTKQSVHMSLIQQTKT